MRLLYSIVAALLATWPALAGQVPNPANVSSPMTTGNCVQATGPNQIGTVGGACPALQPSRFIAGHLDGANFNSTADQAIALAGPASGGWLISMIYVKNCSANLTAAQGGLYAAAGKTTPILGTSSTFSYVNLSASNRAAITSASINNWGASGTSFIPYYTSQSQTIYLSLTTAQGSAATCDIDVEGMIAP